MQEIGLVVLSRYTAHQLPIIVPDDLKTFFHHVYNKVRHPGYFLQALGEGHCRKEGQPGAFTNAEFFTKVAENTTGLLQAQTADGFLFRVDVRLRPEGAYGPLVRSLASLENYYAAAGQTWERMALIKARPVAGDLALGAELLESLQSYRYPRHPPYTTRADWRILVVELSVSTPSSGRLN